MERSAEKSVEISLAEKTSKRVGPDNGAGEAGTGEILGHLARKPEKGEMGTGTIVLYDGECPICKHWAQKRWEREVGNVDYRPYQSVDLESYHVEKDEVEREIQIIGADGIRRGGGAALAYLWRQDGGWRGVVGVLMSAAPLRTVVEIVYRKIAQNRQCIGRNASAGWVWRIYGNEER